MKIQNMNKCVNIIWIFLCVGCFFLFYFTFDPSVLVVSGNLILEGHFCDYYEQMEAIIGKGGIYPILMPLLYAVWNIPVRLITGSIFLEISNIPLFVLYWNKLMVICVYLFTGWELERLIFELRRNEIKVKNIWFFMPVSFFIVVMMGIYDIWYVFFMVLGLRYYFSNWQIKRGKNKYYFIFCFGISICFKTLPILYFIPLLLAREKRVRTLVCDIFVFVIPYLLCAFPYLRSKAFVENCLKFSGNSSGMLMVNTFGQIIPVVVFLILIYGYVYFKIDDGNEQKNKIVYVCNYISCIVFGLGAFHPQWFLITVPFFVLLLVYTDENRIDIIIILNFLLTGIYFVMFAKKKYFGSFQGLLDTGLLGRFGFDILEINEYITLDKMYPINDLNLICSCFLGIMLCIVFYSHEKNGKYIKQFSECKLFTMFIASLAIFIIPVVNCYLPIWPRYIYASEINPVENSSSIILNHANISEYFTESKDFIMSKIVFRTVTWGNDYGYGDKLVIRVVQPEESGLIYETQLLLTELPNNGLVEVDIPDLSLTKGKYKLEFILKLKDESQDFALTKLKAESQNDRVCLTVNGNVVKMEELQIQIIGRYR